MITQPRAHIMVVDDIAENLQVLGNILHKEDFNTSFAQNGKEALEIIFETLPDLILLDITMPEMDGFEVCTCLKHDEKTKHIPIIFLTARTELDNVVQGFMLGAADYVTKPFNSRELIARVKTHVEVKQQRELLEKINIVLEEKVKERTMELENANRKLEVANEKLLKLDQIKTEFLSLISHQIRTPLNGILAPIRLLKDKVDNKNLVNLLEIVDESATRLERFSIKALEISNLQMGIYVANKMQIRANDLIEYAILDIQEQLAEKDIKVNINCDADLQLFTDHIILTKGLANILDNACKYSSAHSQIEINITQNTDMMEFSITDYGIGISSKNVSNLFQMFAPGEKLSHENLGMGLFHSKLIVETLGGSIKIESVEKQETTVRLRIPIN